MQEAVTKFNTFFEKFSKFLNKNRKVEEGRFC